MVFFRPRSVHVRELTHADTGDLASYLERDPVGAAFLRERLQNTASAARTPTQARFYGLFSDDQPSRLDRENIAGGGRALLAVAFAGVNVVPHGPWGSFAGASSRLVATLLEQCRFPSSIFGPSLSVLPIWEQFAMRGIAAFDLREHQPLMVMDREEFELSQAYWPLGSYPEISRSSVEDFEPIFEACVDMFTEEVGYSPIEESIIQGYERHPNAHDYRERTKNMVEAGRSFSHLVKGRVRFKAEFSTQDPENTSVQGVWLEPSARGQGLSAGYVRALAAQGLKSSQRVSLYVNSYNLAARSAYARAGFIQRGAFSTVLF